MNRERLAELADYIESGAHPFSMESFDHCFIGQACRLWGHGVNSDANHARELLSLTKIETLELFFADSDPKLDLRDIRRSDAVRCLREAARTGVIDWEGAM